MCGMWTQPNMVSFRVNVKFPIVNMAENTWFVAQLSRKFLVSVERKKKTNSKFYSAFFGMSEIPILVAICYT